MKNRIQSFAYAGAIALLSMGLAACSTEDEATVQQPSMPEGEVSTVPVNFVFNVSTSNQATRMSSAATQATTSENFRGIENATLLAYKQTKTEGSNTVPDDGKHIWTSTKADKPFDLSTILSSNQITSTDSRRIIELSLPLATNTLMFYGKAIKDNGDHDMQGKIDFHPGEGGDDSYFRLQSRMSTVTNSGAILSETRDLIAGILTRIANTALEKETAGEQRDLRYAFYWLDQPSATGDDAVVLDNASAEKAALFAEGSSYESGVSTITYNGKGYRIYFGEKKWSYYGETYAAGTTLKPLEEILGEAYHEFTDIKTGEIRAGSGTAVERTIGDLWLVINKVRKKTTENTVGATATSVDEFIAQLMAERINTRLDTYFTLTAGTGACAFKNLSAIKLALQNYAGISQSTYSHLVEGQVRTFPTNLNLPLGTAQLTFTNDKQFKYRVDDVTLGINGSGGVSVDKIMWPAELCYFGNSPIRTSDDSKVTDDFPATVSEWENDNSTQWSTFTKNGHILSTTRSVAMQNDINYGTALFCCDVQYTSAELKDNNAAMHTGEDDKVISANGTQFTLTGVLVGGQNNEMGWNYLRKYTTDDDTKTPKQYSTFDFVIYDSYVGAGGNGTAIPAFSENKATTPNYTLVFDNFNSKATDQDKVNICLEFRNNGDDFFGRDNLIRKGATFYILGQLDPESASNTITWPTATATKVCHPLPPYYTTDTTVDGETVKAGSTIETPRIFMQDYMTTAHFKLGVNSLKYAFVTVPDLRATQTSLGLSVDIEWSTGLNFNDVILGGN